jgi:C1A family cysteine protease
MKEDKDMERLTAALKEQITAKPLNTQVRSENTRANDAFLRSLQKIDETRKVHLPHTFDGRKTWEGLLTPPPSQGECGSCWAWASTSALADRFSIQSMGLMNTRLSATKLILCDLGGKEISISHSERHRKEITDAQVRSLTKNACHGSTLFDAFRYLYVIGTCTETCLPYNKTLGKALSYDKIGSVSSAAHLPLCTSVSGPLGAMCSDFYIDEKTGVEIGTPQRFYKAYEFYAVSGSKEEGGSQDNIRRDIFLWGPASTAFKVYPDFYTFDAKNTIYESNQQEPQVGGHSVVIVGWGKEKGKEYWIVRNSWGKEWGRNGYFYMIRGTNNCELESNVMCPIPSFFYPLDGLGAPHVSGTAETPEQKQEMIDIATNREYAAGGINPETGYTRRAMMEMPWLLFARPVKLDDLPNWSKFTAGLDADVKNRAIYQATVRHRRSDERYSEQATCVFTAVMSIILVGTIVVLIRTVMRMKK